MSWPRFSPSHTSSRPSVTLAVAVAVVVALAVTLTLPSAALGFCGFYVAKADATLWNQASQVALVRDGDRTVLTMSNDFSGDLKEFALVVPVPVVLQKEQIHVGERKLIERLDAFSAPRLVEYFDPNPCQVMMEGDVVLNMAPAPMAKMSTLDESRARALGVTVVASYTVGEYDILILSAKESSGLETWLRENGYQLPKGASQALAPYIRQDFRFFVAKVNLAEQAKTGFNYLRPLQMAYESPRFMLPIRLGMLNANGPQDLVAYLLTRQGRVEASNYRTLKMPSGMDVPLFVKDEFAKFYRATFDTAWAKEGKNAVFLEYFWDMSWCDPCAADPLSPEELRQIGVFWLEPQGNPRQGSMQPVPPQASSVLLTRLHVRYDAAHFPEDLAFQETRDRENFQGRYVLRHPFAGALSCPAGKAYVEEVKQRRQQEATTLASLTGWPIEEVRRKQGPLPVSYNEPAPTPPAEWWRSIWK